MRCLPLFVTVVIAACRVETSAPTSAPTTAPAASTEPAAAGPLTVPPEELRATAQAAYQAEDWAGCAEAFESLATEPTAHDGDAYNAACCYARAGAEAQAFDLLAKAAALGWKNVEHVKADPDLTSLRDRPRWSEAVAGFQANLDRYLDSINRELYEIYQADQGDRRAGHEGIDWEVVSARDHARQARVLEIVEAGEAKTGDDWFHAAMVMQHGDTPEDYQRAHEWALRASELSPEHRTARWLAAAAKDRWLMNEGKPQLYGTQFIKKDDRWVLYEVDPSVTDEERARWNVPPLAEAQRRAEQMNQR